MVECSAHAARSRVCTSIPAVTLCVSIMTDASFSASQLSEAAALFDIFTVFKEKNISKK